MTRAYTRLPVTVRHRERIQKPNRISEEEINEHVQLAVDSFTKNLKWVCITVRRSKAKYSSSPSV